MDNELKELEEKLTRLKKEKKDADHKKEVEAKIRKLEHEKKTSTKVFKFLGEMLDYIQVDKKVKK